MGENNINDLQEERWEGMDWIDMVQDRDRWGDIVNAVMNFGFHKMLGFFLTRQKPVSFSSRPLLYLVS